MHNPSRRRVAKFIARELANGESTARVAKILAAYLYENRELRNWELLLRDIETSLLNDHKYLAAEVLSARKLSHETIDNLREMLMKETGAKKIEILPETDENLIGGVVIRTPESEMDSSLRAKLTKLRAI
jgi:F0F1-type ATP synthase delta subunit